LKLRYISSKLTYTNAIFKNLIFQIPTTDWYNPVQFKAGDHLGFANLVANRGSISAGVDFEQTLFHLFGNNQFPTIGDKQEIKVVAVTYKYSLSAEFATHPKLCKYWFAFFPQ
jgi:hypothetical protein